MDPYSYKCNKFVADAYKKGADVDYPTYPGGNWPIVANDAAKQWFNMGDFNYVGNGDLKAGDILIFPPPGPNQHGHCAIYAGAGWMISAVPDKGVVYTRIVDDYHFKNNGGKIAMRRYNPEPL